MLEDSIKNQSILAFLRNIILLWIIRSASFSSAHPAYNFVREPSRVNYGIQVHFSFLNKAVVPKCYNVREKHKNLQEELWNVLQRCNNCLSRLDSNGVGLGENELMVMACMISEYFICTVLSITLRFTLLSLRKVLENNLLLMVFQILFQAKQ